MPDASPECLQVKSPTQPWRSAALYPHLFDADNKKINTSFPHIHRNNLAVHVINGKLSSARASHSAHPESPRSLYAGQALDSLAQLDVYDI